MTQEQFEQAVLAALTAGDDPVFETLRAQLERAEVTERTPTDHGFFTYVSVPSDAPRLPRRTMRIGDLQVQLEGAKTPADAILHIEGGVLRSLECYVYDGAFPQTPQVTAAWYYGTERFPALDEELFAARDVEDALDEE